MKKNIVFKKSFALSLLASLLIFNACSKKESSALSESINNDSNLTTFASTPLYTESGSNPPFSNLNLSPSTSSVAGSTINVNNSLVDVSTGASNISTNIKIHTLTSTNIPYANAPNFGRWWRLDGKTQVFRLFKDEISIIDPRGTHPRIEAFSLINWTYNANVYHTWYGRYTIISVDDDGACIFQDKNTVNDWAFQLLVNGNGDIILDDRNLPKSENVVIKANAIGQGFNIRVRDNGRNWECFLDNVSVGTGSYNRPTGVNQFRWGMYASKKQIKNSMIFVSGVNFN